MQRLARVIFAQGLWGIRLSRVEDLPVVIAPAFNKPTTVFNDFSLLYYTIAYFMRLFYAHTFFCYKHIFGLYHTIVTHDSASVEVRFTQCNV